MSQQLKEIRGSKGGKSKQHTPVESPDNLRSIAKAKILVALGEGEFAGTPTAQDIFLDDTPLANPSGGANFPGVKWDYRSGSQDQDYIKGMPAVENEYSLNYELTNSLPYVRAVTDTSLSAVRVRFRWPMLQRQKDNGDLVGSSMTYAIDLSTDGGPYETVLQESVTGKSTTGYERSRRIDLPNATTGWQIRVRRVSADSTSSNNINTTYVVGFTEIIDAKFRYPNTALLYVEFDATQFQNIPKISCKVKMREWPVPSNYDPETRTYTGIWNGTFKMAWTDNPVWVCNGILVNSRFGTGERITQDDVDKWELYKISQYCDVLVSDGKGGLEPRFTCNVYIQSKEDAWAVLRDLTSIYRGMVYWGQSKITSVADMPRDIDYIFTRSNVIDGKFQYSGGSEREVYTRAIVGYNNPDNMYEPDAVAVFDRDLQLRYGDNLLELTAMGCAKQSEAQRRGYWALYTNSKNRAVSFQVGLDGQIPMPGYVIGVADPLLAGQPLGGRIASVSALDSLTLDRDTQAEAGDLLVVNLPSGIAQSRTIMAVADNGRDITLTTDFSEMPEAEAQWAIEKEDLVIQQFRVTKVTRDSDYTFTIEGVEHDPDKYARVDNGARLEERPITVIPPSVQAPPTDVQISTFTNVEQTMAVTTMRITWEPAENAVYYVVEWRKDDKDWITMPRVGSTSVDIEGVYTGNYIARVRAYNAVDVASLPASSLLTAVVGKEGTPPVLSSLTTTSKIFGIDLDWVFPTGATDTNYTEIQYNTSPSEIDVLLLGTFAYPLDTYTMAGLAAGQQFFFRARLVDKTGNIGEWTNWVVGQASADAELILDYLTGQITETQLGSDLMEQIDTGGGAAIQIEELTDDLSAMYSIKLGVDVEGRYYGAGMGLGIENTPAGMQSQVLFVADRFAILNQIGGNVSSPFIVQGGQTIINEAIIGDATIGTAKIADAAITNAKIENGSITSAKIGNAQITNAKIGNAQVDTLKIAGQSITIPASSYASGTVTVGTGWTTVASATITSAGSPISIIATAEVGEDGGQWTSRRAMDARLICTTTGAVLSQVNLSLSGGTISGPSTVYRGIKQQPVLMANYTRGNGTAKFDLQVKVSSNSSPVKRRFIEVKETRR